MLAVQSLLEPLGRLSVLQFAGLVLGGLVATVVLLWAYAYPYSSWANSSKNLPGPESQHPIAGNLLYVIKRMHPRPIYAEWIHQYGHTGILHGLLGKKRIYTADPTAIQHLFQNSDKWPKAEGVNLLIGGMLGPGLITAEGSDHRRMRRVLNPAFSPRAVKEMTPIFFDKARAVRDKFAQLLEDAEGAPKVAVIEAKVAQDGSGRIDVGMLMEQTTLDMIGAAGFDYDFQTLFSKRSELLDAFHSAIRAMQASALVSALQNRFTFLSILPTPGRKLRQESQRTMNRVGDMLVRDKTRAVTQLGIDKDTDFNTADLLSRLIRANMASDLEERQRLSQTEVRAQICTFIFAGSETTGVALTYGLYRLATMPALQDRLRAEIDTLSENADLDEIHSLPLLENFTREILRVDSPVPVVSREAGRRQSLPLGRPVVGRDGTVMDSVVVDKGTEVVICIANVNRDKTVWGDDADEFNPDRYDRPNYPHGSVPGIYGNLMTFIGGPRNCIGWRFALAEFKIVLSTLIRAYSFAETPSKPEILGETTMGVVRTRTKGQEGVVVPLMVRALNA